MDARDTDEGWRGKRGVGSRVSIREEANARGLNYLEREEKSGEGSECEEGKWLGQEKGEQKE